MKGTLDRYFHLKFKKWQFMKGYANFVPGPNEPKHWDANFSMYSPREALWNSDYGERFSLSLNGTFPMTKKDTGLNDTFVSEDGKYIVIIKDRGFLPDEKEYKGNSDPLPVVEMVKGLELLDADRIAALSEEEKAKLENIEITHAKDLLITFMNSSKTVVNDAGITVIIGWSPWYEALQKILAAHPVRTAVTPIYSYTEGRTIKGAEIELHIGTEIYRTADFYWHGDITSQDQIADPKTAGDYGGFKRCSTVENYSFASFHFEPVKEGYQPIRTTDE